ncbi:MAG: IS1595 family transposase [Desulfurellaceae bacterium]|nr:IS1595 family transposase [Desulfurellaceae bacterium]
MAKAPGKSHRKGLTLLQIADKFGDEEKAREWLESLRWPDGPTCPYCGTTNVQANIKHKSMTHRCRECPKKPMFTVRIGTIMEQTRLKYRVWAIGMYLYTTNLKGISSMKLHRELGITQKSAWFVLHRLRKAAETGTSVFAGPVEVDETYTGGKNANKHASKKIPNATGTLGKTPVVGMKDRKTNKVSATVVKHTNQETLHGFVTNRIEPGTKIYTDEHGGYVGLDNHETVKHSVSEYVNGMAHTNGIESFWATLKRGYHGTYHHVSEKHLGRYVTEFAERHNDRPLDTIEQMKALTHGMVGKRLEYKDLVA